MSSNFNTLTSKQKKVYLAIENYIKSKGIPPTVREIGEMVGEKTPGAVQGILNRLEQKGVIKREVGAARSIQLVSDDLLYVKASYIPELKKVNRRSMEDIFNIYNIKKYHPVSPELIEDSEGLFIISCPDNSLADSGIGYGDILVMDTVKPIKDGDIILVLYENYVVLRHYYETNEQNIIKLTAESDLIGKELFDKDEITIAAKLTAKLTKY